VIVRRVVEARRPAATVDPDAAHDTGPYENGHAPGRLQLPSFTNNAVSQTLPLSPLLQEKRLGFDEAPLDRRKRRWRRWLCWWRRPRLAGGGGKAVGLC
jgi:hypothetical protein